nr:MAG TPA: hypothetical protein [Caudoviricetes sp.]DAU94047.1 MAG TPA: hypothetical protein [Caudoviricetes sp.]
MSPSFVSLMVFGLNFFLPFLYIKFCYSIFSF